MKKIIILAFSLMFSVTGYSQSLYYAKKLLEEGNYRLAAEQLRPLAEGGNSEAQYLAAQLFATGKGVIKSNDQAEKYYTMAINGGQKNAAMELVELFEKNNQQAKAAKLMERLLNDSEEWKSTLLAYKYGSYLYHGHGNVTCNKMYGWGLMARSGCNNDSLALLKNDFFSFVIKENDNMLYLLCDYIWNHSGTDKKWTANYLDDAFLFIKSLPQDRHIDLFRECDSLLNSNSKSEATAIILSMMYAEGVGTEKNYDKAKMIYSTSINDSTYDLLFDNLFKNNLDGLDGHLKRADFPEFWNVVLNDYRERKERWDYEKNKNNITLSCRATCFKLVSIEAFELKDGNVAVEFNVYNTSPNASGRTTRAYYGGIRCNGQYYGEKNGVRLSYYIPGDVGIKGHSTTIFRIEIPKHLLPTSKVIESVSFFLDSNWGKQGLVSAMNVVWKAQGK